LTGSSGDYVAKIWDLTSMNKLLRPVKEFKPFPGHQVRALSFSPDQNSSMFLCCCANNQAAIYSRDGSKIKTTVRGDMYIQDMANTKGHVASITGGMFHPKQADIFLTSSLDGSVRQWDLNAKLYGMDQNLPQRDVLKTKDNRGLKVGVKACTYNHKGEMIMAGCLDGSI
jgi:WD40 repeat protein